MRDLWPVRFPLEELWDEGGLVSNSRQDGLGAESIKVLLRREQVRFAVADAGRPLHWVPLHACFAFWKAEVQPHLIEPARAEQGVNPGDLPGEYGYLASLWQADSAPVVLLQKLH